MSRASENFAATYHAAPYGVWAAPGRVNMIGEHTDYNDGLVLPFALAQRTYVAARRRADSRVRVVSAQMEDDGVLEFDLLRREPLPIWARYVAGILWALGCSGGFDLFVDSQVPLGAGLSSSAALMCAVALAADELMDLHLPLMGLAEAGMRAENDFVGAPTGMMDEVAAFFGAEGHALLFDVRSRAVEQIPFDPGAHELSVLVIDTRVAHALARSEYRYRRESCEEAVRRLGVQSLRDVGLDQLDRAQAMLDDVTFRRVRHVVTENHRVLQAAEALRGDRWQALAGFMNDSHASLRDDYEVSCEELDATVETALEAGATGARMTGGGFGGSVLALVPISRVNDVQAAIEETCAVRQFPRPSFLEAYPGPAASRVE